MSAHAEIDYRLVRRDTPCRDVPTMFADTSAGGHVLGAVLTTNGGEPDETLLGIITPWDAAKLIDPSTSPEERAHDLRRTGLRGALPDLRGGGR